MADEEAVGFRAFNLLLALGLRGCAFPDVSHQQWGDHERAIQSSGLQGAILKGTLICSCGAGPYTSGRNHFTVSRAAELLLQDKDEDWLEQFAADVAWDRCVPEHEVCLTKEDWLQSPGIGTRLKKACRVQNYVFDKVTEHQLKAVKKQNACCFSTGILFSSKIEFSQSL